MEAVLCFLKFALFLKKLQKMKMSIIILVSGLWAAPGAHLALPSVQPSRGERSEPPRRPSDRAEASEASPAVRPTDRRSADPPTDRPYTLTPDRPPLAASYW